VIGVLGAVLIGSGTAVAIANTLTTRALWASPMFDRSQKVAQTALMWLLPGTFLVTRHFVRGGFDRSVPDPTVPPDYGIPEDPTHYNQGHVSDGGDGGHN